MLRLVSFRGLIQNFWQASVPLWYGSSPPQRRRTSPSAPSHPTTSYNPPVLLHAHREVLYIPCWFQELWQHHTQPLLNVAPKTGQNLNSWEKNCNCQTQKTTLNTRPQLFKGWITLSAGWISINWIMQLFLLILILWMVIYLVDSPTQRLNNRGLKCFWASQ